MVNEHSTVVHNLTNAVGENEFWNDYFSHLSTSQSTPFAVHLAVFVEPFLKYILDGKKTIETRFSSVRCAPYERVKRGDIILLKKTGGPIVGICQIRNARFYELEKNSWLEIKEYAREICAEDPAFWEERRNASYATLMRIQNVQAIDPVKFTKRDRRGWVVLQKSSQQLSLQAGEL